MSLRLKAQLGVGLCSLLWGVTFVVVKAALVDSSPLAFMAARFTLGALPMAWFYREDLRKLSKAEFWDGTWIGALMFGGYAFQTAGIARTTASKAAFITGFTSVLVPILLALIWRKRINAWVWSGAIASVAGLYYLTVPREGITDFNKGDLLVLCCSFLYAFQIIYIGHFSGKYSLGNFSFLQVAATAALSLGAVPLLAFTHVEPFRFHFTPAVIFGVLVSAIFTTAIAYPLLIWAQRYTSASHTALILTTEPVFAAITSFVVLHERLGPRALVGAALILGGILLAELKGPVPPAEETHLGA